MPFEGGVFQYRLSPLDTDASLSQEKYMLLAVHAHQDWKKLLKDCPVQAIPPDFRSCKYASETVFHLLPPYSDPLIDCTSNNRYSLMKGGVSYPGMAAGIGDRIWTLQELLCYK